MKTLGIVCLCLCLAALPGRAELRVVAHPDVPVSEISETDLKAVFLLNKSDLHGSRVQPVLLATSLPTFCQFYLGKSQQALETYYRSRVFSGQGAMPVRLASDAAVVAHVARTPGAIGFIDVDSPSPGLKTLRVRSH
jgi:hypothetical protein